jgi:putative membrane protein
MHAEGQAKIGKSEVSMIRVSDDRLFGWFVMGLAVGAVASGIHPYRFWPWVFEIIPVMAILAVLVLTRSMFVFTRMAYLFMAAALVMMIIGAHYTYAQMPCFNSLRETFHLSRNHYDRIGHFMQGLVPAMFLREMFLRSSSLSRGVIIALVITLCTGISALFELVEWAAVMVTGADVNVFLGTQGDFWDAQRDMVCALSGAVSYCIFLSGPHDRAIAAVTAYPIPSPERAESLRYRFWSRFLKWFGMGYHAFEPPRIRADHIRQLLRMLEPGSILCHDDLFYFSRPFIPGKYTHSAVVIDERTAIHSVPNGVEYIDVIDFVKDSDGFILLRPSYPYGGAKRVVEEAQALLRQGTRYNFSFRDRKAAMYCHEFTNRCLATVHLDVKPKRHRMLGFIVRDIVHADLFIEAFPAILEIHHPTRSKVRKTGAEDK